MSSCFGVCFRLARWIKETLKQHRILLSTDGPYENVIKIKPPMCFTAADADTLMQALRHVLKSELTADVQRGIAEEERQYRESVVLPRMQRYRANEEKLTAALLARQPIRSWNVVPHSHAQL